MAWEDRNGRRYYYKKRREGRRVVSEYYGSGEFAELFANLDYLDREEELTQRHARRRELEMWLDLDREINQALDLCSIMLNAAMLSAGLHTHKGQWRRDRGRR